MRLETLGVEFWVIVGLMVLCVALLSSFMASLYRKAGPHEALIVYVFRGTRIVKGHGTVIFPMVEMFHQLSLELMSFDVAPMQDLYTKQGVVVTVEASLTRVRLTAATPRRARARIARPPPRRGIRCSSSWRTARYWCCRWRSRQVPYRSRSDTASAAARRHP